MTRFTSPLIVLLLCGTALAGCASDGGGMFGGAFSGKKTEAKTAAAAPAAQPSEATMTMDIESGVQQAQTERLAQRYDDAIHTLSQLMLVASDDPRVVGEYGKTLAEKGRAQDAVQFLTRATQLQPTDWTTYSALGVAYDQMGDQSAARMAYEHALKLNPNEASVLNNYALSRMLANDPQTAHQLIVRAQSAGGRSDPKIARNIELMDKLAPASAAAPVADHKVAAEAAPVPVSAPVAVSSSPLPPATPAAQKAPAPQHAAPAKVVMQAVPVDPLAGPAKSATHEPTSLAAKAGVKTDAKIVAKTDVKPAETKPVMSSATAKIDIKPDAKLAAKADVKPAEAKPVTSGVTAKADIKPDTKTATVKPEAKPVKPTETADAKPVSVKSDAKAVAAKPRMRKPPAKPVSKTAIPALRQTASAY